MRKPKFCLYKCENEVADQMCGTCICTADQRLCLRYRNNKSVSDPEDSFFFATRLRFNYNDKQPLQEGLSACIQCVGMGKLGWVKAISIMLDVFISNYMSIMLFWLLYEWNVNVPTPTPQ